MPRIEFKDKKSESKEAIVVSFDLSGFSDFCNRPDACIALPRFLSNLFEEQNRFLMGAVEWFFAPGRSEAGRLAAPNFIKYTGDGAIMIWLADDKAEFTEQFCTDLVLAMRALQSRIATIVPEWEKKWRVHGLPQNARFGIAIGTLYPLCKPDSIFDEAVDYVGYCINLAVRLQDHCREVGFLVHETLHPKIPGLVRLRATGMKGAQIEPVLAYETDFKKLPIEVFDAKFQKHLSK
jgi:class 3 adenylate cyclase